MRRPTPPTTFFAQLQSARAGPTARRRGRGRHVAPRGRRRSPRRRGALSPHRGAHPADAPARVWPGTRPRRRTRLRGSGGSAAAATAGGAAGGGAAKGDVSLAAQPALAPAPAPRRSGPRAVAAAAGPGQVSYLQPEKREGEREGRSRVAAAEPGERSRPSLRRKATPEQLQTPRPRRRPPRPPSAPAASWLRARVWSRGTFCLGAGERPPPPGSPPPAFPTRASHSSGRLSPLARAPPLRRALANQSAGGQVAAAVIGQRGGSPPGPMGEGRSCREPGGRSRGGAGLRGARPRAGAGRGRPHRQTGEGAPTAHAHCGPAAPLPRLTPNGLLLGGRWEVRVPAALGLRP